MSSSNDRDDQGTALAEGRRIYLGNLLYATKPSEIEQALEDHGFGNYAQIHVSVDPVSGRNPGYCFVDFNDSETAERALSSLSATVRGRPLKVGPCQAKQQGQRRERRGWGESADRSEGSSSFQRWGDWKKGGDGTGNSSGPRKALDHFNASYGDDKDQRPRETNSKRLYIGGLGKMLDQDQNQQEMSELLAGFNPVAIGKRITARDREDGSNQTWPNRNYCFVDFETADEAQKAMEALHGTPYGEGYLKVSLARGAPDQRRTRQWERGNGNGNIDSSNVRPTPRALDSNNWRRKE